jgi:hypothetical protein
LLGIRNGNSTPPLQPPQSPHTPTITITHTAPTTPSIFHIGDQERNARQPTINKSQWSSPNWLLYKSEFGYQYYYPRDWQFHPEARVPESSVVAPGPKKPDGSFVVQRLFPKTCNEARKLELEQNEVLRAF